MHCCFSDSGRVSPHGEGGSSKSKDTSDGDSGDKSYYGESNKNTIENIKPSKNKTKNKTVPF